VPIGILSLGVGGYGAYHLYLMATGSRMEALMVGGFLAGCLALFLAMQWKLRARRK
jgi:hypothetical protein